MNKKLFKILNQTIIIYNQPVISLKNTLKQKKINLNKTKLAIKLLKKIRIKINSYLMKKTI